MLKNKHSSLLELKKDVSLVKNIEKQLVLYKGSGQISEIYLKFESKYTKIKVTIDSANFINDIYLKDLEDKEVYDLPDASNLLISYHDDGRIFLNFKPGHIAYESSLEISATSTKDDKKFNAGYVVMRGGV